MIASLALAAYLAQQTNPAPPVAAPPPPTTTTAATPARTQLNLLGQTDTASGESRRNENVQFNLIDTNTIKELNVRLGTTATLVEEFKADRGYFGGEYGNRPGAPIHLTPTPSRPGLHGSLFAAHNNSIFTARAFFQAGGVRPARENQYGFALGGALSQRWRLTLDGMQQKLRGQVNGNVLVPLASERTPLTNDPILRPIIQRYLDAYKAELPNRTDIDPRALNTNSQQLINTDNAGARVDFTASARDRLGFAYRFTSQQVKAFQLIAGQNPDTDIKSHAPRITWTRAWSPKTLLHVTVGFDRSGTLIKPEKNAVGQTVSFGNAIGGLGPAPPIPIDRAVNKFRQAAAMSHNLSRHTVTYGGEIIRNQVNGLEQDGNRGILSFTNDFGRDSITNFRLGTASNFTQAIGNNIRGFRYWNTLLFLDDRYKASQNLTLHFGIRHEAMTRPVEVNHIDTMPFGCDCNNVAPRFGFAYRTNRGVVRGAYGVHFGEIFATTFGQTRLSPPGSYRVFVGAPDLRNPLAGVDLSNLGSLRAGIFSISPDLATPYSHQYNFSWEPPVRGGWKLQLGYVGSRSIKLFQMWFDNRGRNDVPGVPNISATLNDRRADPRYLEVFRLLNASRGYYDAGRVSLIAPPSSRFGGDVSYWFSRAIDLGNDYTSTLAGQDARTGRSQTEQNVHADLKALSSYEQKHALLFRGNADLPTRWLKGWKLNGVWLLKNGTPFSVESGSDGPGFGNVDGQGSDRVHILNPAILGSIVGNPDTSQTVLARSSFAFMGPGESRGNIGRNTFRRGKIANVNASLQRTWRLPREMSLNLRGESINLLNTPQFAEPNFNLASPSFGRITNTLNDGRTFRFQLTLGF
jgi:hypothetical protein